MGGDDYLTKPFSPRELVARVKRLFKRTSIAQTAVSPKMDGDRIIIDELEIYKSERRVIWQEEEYEVTTKEFDMLLFLAENVNRAFSRDELLMKIWGNDYFGSDRAVDDLIKRIRKKFKNIPIDTVWGYGYRMRKEEETE